MTKKEESGETQRATCEEAVAQYAPVTMPPKRGLAVAKKILELRNKVQEIKTSKMKSGKLNYSYLSENEMTKAIRPVMQELGLIILPMYTQCKTQAYDLKNVYEGKETSKPVLLTEVRTDYAIVDTETGDSITISAVGGGADQMDKGINKANTCAFKNALRALGMFPSPEREDPDTTPSDGSKPTHYSSDAGSIVLKYGEHVGKTIKQVYDIDPKEVEKLANGNSKWIAGKAQEFLDSLNN